MHDIRDIIDYLKDNNIDYETTVGHAGNYSLSDESSTFGFIASLGDKTLALTQLTTEGYDVDRIVGFTTSLPKDKLITLYQESSESQLAQDPERPYGPTSLAVAVWGLTSRFDDIPLETSFYEEISDLSKIKEYIDSSISPKEIQLSSSAQEAINTFGSGDAPRNKASLKQKGL